MGVTLSDTESPQWLADERLCRVAWNRLADPGDTAAASVRERYGVSSSLALLLAGRHDGDQEVAGLLRRWSGRLTSLDPARDARNARAVGVRVLMPGDEEWPERVTDLGIFAPACLWAKGPGRPHWGRSVALVGSRACTNYGLTVASDLASGLAGADVTVVSGGAYGIDVAAHRSAVVTGGTTVAILAGGLDRLYPKGNETMLRHLGESHLLLSEAAPGVAPARWRFLERNRLIAALSSATVVVEAAWRSGALSTAGHAATIGRPLGAVPGPITSAMSAGCHRLLRDYDATCVTDVGDVLELLGLRQICGAGPEAAQMLDPIDLRVFDALMLGRGQTAETLAEIVGLEQVQVRAVLGRLDLAGHATLNAGLWKRRGSQG